MPKIPGVNHTQAVRALQKIGYLIIREGKRIVMSNGENRLTIPRHNLINAYTMGAIAQDSGLTPKRICGTSSLLLEKLEFVPQRATCHAATAQARAMRSESSAVVRQRTRNFFWCDVSPLTS